MKTRVPNRTEESVCRTEKNRPAEAEVDSSGFQYVAIGLMVAVWVFKRTKTILFVNFLKE